MLVLTPILFQFPMVLGESTTNAVLSGQVFEFFFKIIFVLIAALYVAFAFVMTRQIKIMSTTLITPVAPMITLIGYVHMFLALAVLFFFFVVL